MRIEGDHAIHVAEPITRLQSAGRARTAGKDPETEEAIETIAAEEAIDRTTTMTSGDDMMTIVVMSTVHEARDGVESANTIMQRETMVLGQIEPCLEETTVVTVVRVVVAVE